MGLLATGTSCFALVWVSGRSRDPAPPQSTSAFIRRSAWRSRRYRSGGWPFRSGRRRRLLRHHEHAAEVGSRHEHDVDAREPRVLLLFGTVDEVARHEVGLGLLP